MFANVVFDGEGKILAIYVDQLEYATPNYDGAEMPHFSGWPGPVSYTHLDVYKRQFFTPPGRGNAAFLFTGAPFSGIVKG